EGDRRVAFTGSANETWSGHRRNYESIDVYRNWIDAEAERVAIKVEQFDEAWGGLAEGLQVLPPSGEVLERLIARAPKRLPKPTRQAAEAEEPDPKWRHQEEAVEA